MALAGLGLGLVFGLPHLSLAMLPKEPYRLSEVPRMACPQTIEALMERMLQDLPSYANRTRTRAQISASFVVLAGRPEFESLPLSTLPEVSSSTQQVFFTTLQRRYGRDRLSYLQEYHWLFLTPTPKDWQFVMLYSTFGPYPAAPDQPPQPPRNSSEGSTAVAIRDWLADCRAGQLPVPPPPRAPLKFPFKLP